MNYTGQYSSQALLMIVPEAPEGSVRLPQEIVREGSREATRGAHCYGHMEKLSVRVAALSYNII